jgi:hypothetical protein
MISPLHASEIGARQLQLEYIRDRCEAIRRLPIIAQDFAILGDEAGVGYALQQLTTCLRDAAKTYHEPPEPREAV